MRIYDELVEKAIAWAIPASSPASSAEHIQYYGQVGDFFGGFWGTIIGVVTLVVVVATWRSTRKIDNRSKIYQVFAEILRTHEEIVTSLRLGNLSGREAISEILSEFYTAYAEIREVEREDRIYLSMDRRINAAFVLVYYGAHPETADLFSSSTQGLDGRKLCERIYRRKRSSNRNIILSKLSASLDGDPSERAIWHQSIRDSFDLIRQIDIPNEQKRLLREVLAKAQNRPHNNPDKREIVAFIESHSLSTEFGGHQNRLSHYFRNLHSAFVFIDEQKLTAKEKDSLSKVLRSKLSNYEQALLAINALTDQGSSWIKLGLMDRYMPIKNVPRHFFNFDDQFDLKKSFPSVKFEWEA
ncbi:putative phage abortive infection protein [Rubrivivax sp. RP6-9]|uniref:putative phage abortive infection protein n=1 Tax=Rubrivivax sp. RP6-9 TaxID=3415750 RepID=UPI003CC5DECC